MKNLYLANIWPQIVTKKGISLFEKAGFHISGNWLNGDKNFSNIHKIIFPYANFGDSLQMRDLYEKDIKKTISYLLFPDAVVGWDYINNKYLLSKNHAAEELMSLSLMNLSHSDYSTSLIKKTYGDIALSTIPLGVDTNTIFKMKRKSKTLKVLWNHMWRADKGVDVAFDIINTLANKFPKVEFLIGQKDTWTEYPGSEQFKNKCLHTLNKLEDLKNVTFLERIKRQNNYWQFLNQATIGFSTAFHEGFGLSMMEQEAAGLACVVPNEEVYPELHKGCLFANRTEILEKIETLILNPQIRKNISESCRQNAFKYDISIWVKQIIIAVFQ